MYDSASYGSASCSYANLGNTPSELQGSTNYPRASDEAESHSSLQAASPQGTPGPAGGAKVDLGHRVPLVRKEIGYNLGFLWFLVYKSGEGIEVCKETFDFLFFFFSLTLAHFILF